MTRSRLKNVYLKTGISKKWENQKKQKNFAQICSKKNKRRNFRNLNINDINDDKKFWKKIKPFFSDKDLETNNIILKEQKTN